MYGGWCGVCVVLLVCDLCGAVVLWFCGSVVLCLCVSVFVCVCVLVVCVCVNGLTIEAIPPGFHTCTLQNHKITKPVLREEPSQNST